MWELSITLDPYTCKGTTRSFLSLAPSINPACLNASEPLTCSTDQEHFLGSRTPTSASVASRRHPLDPLAWARRCCSCSTAREDEPVWWWWRWRWRTPNVCWWHNSARDQAPPEAAGQTAAEEGQSNVQGTPTRCGSRSYAGSAGF